jgi:hypothetical protein
MGEMFAKRNRLCRNELFYLLLSGVALRRVGTACNVVVLLSGQTPYPPKSTKIDRLRLSVHLVGAKQVLLRPSQTSFLVHLPDFTGYHRDLKVTFPYISYLVLSKRRDIAAI